MKKRKCGFTVAEMVTAMSIVGVMSAFVLPLSIKSFNKHHAGIILGRAVEQIISGNQNILQIVNTNTADGSYTDSLASLTRKDLYPATNAQDDAILDILGNIVPPFWKLESEVVSPDGIVIRNYKGENVNTSSEILFATATRVNFSRIPASVAMVQSDEAVTNGTLWNIYIDTNRFEKSPNAYGKDIFAFRLMDDGTLLPFDTELAGEENGLQYTEQVVREGFRITYY